MPHIVSWWFTGIQEQWFRKTMRNRIGLLKDAFGFLVVSISTSAEVL